MPNDESWRSQEATVYLDRAQRIGFAWEFLRRNPDYRDDYEHMSHQVASGRTMGMEAALALARRWGLSFPVRSPIAEQPRTDTLGCQCFARCDRPDGRAARHRKHIAFRLFALAGVLRGSQRWTAHAMAGHRRRMAGLDPAGCIANSGGCRCGPIRQVSAATVGGCPAAVATPHGNCNQAGHCVADRAAAPPHGLDAEGA